MVQREPCILAGVALKLEGTGPWLGELTVASYFKDESWRRAELCSPSGLLLVTHHPKSLKPLLLPQTSLKWCSQPCTNTCAGGCTFQMHTSQGMGKYKEIGLSNLSVYIMQQFLKDPLSCHSFLCLLTHPFHCLLQHYSV